MGFNDDLGPIFEMGDRGDPRAGSELRGDGAGSRSDEGSEGRQADDHRGGGGGGGGGDGSLRAERHHDAAHRRRMLRHRLSPRRLQRGRPETRRRRRELQSLRLLGEVGG